MTHRSARRLTWGLWTLSMLLAVVQVVLVILARHVHASPGFGFPGFDSVLTVVAASVGALVASRQPSNPIGWFFVAVGLESGIQGFGLAYALNGILGSHAPWPGAVIGAWFNAWLWFPAIMLITTLGFQLFPDGRFLSARWRRFGWMSGILVIVASTALALTPGSLENFAKVANPFGVRSPIVGAVGNLGFVLANLAIIGSAASLVVRYRRSGHTQREQIKWLAYAAAVAAVVIPGSDFFGSQYKIANAAVILSILFIPIAIGIAVLRYRLYDIDRIISRTVSYAIVTGLLVGGYVGLVIIFNEASRPITGRSDIAVAASTLIVAALFVPLRRRVQTAVDRRFNRHRYDAAQTMDAFTTRLRDEMNIDTLTDELREVVSRTMQPGLVSVWLRKP